MPLFPKNYEELVSTALGQMRANSNITQLTPGAKARFILDTVMREQAGQHELFDQNLLQAFVRWADGRFLDYFGDMMNIPRLETTTASADVDYQNFMFYVETGNFGDINSNVDFVVPAGTEITTYDFPTETPVSGSEADPTLPQTKITYETLTNIACPTNASTAYGAIRARVEGSVSNLPRHSLKEHNFTGYQLSARNVLLCTNQYGIVNGRERESDESYRYRLQNAFKARERANKIAIRLAALSVPGVADVVEINCEQGPGTYSLYTESLAPTTSAGLISNVLAAVEEVSALGVRPYVLAPLPLGLEFTIAVRWRDRTIESEKAVGYAMIRRYINNALDALGIGEDVDLVSLAIGVTTAHAEIAGIGLLTPGSFEEVYLYRSSPDGEGVTKTLFTGEIVEPLYNERILLETSTRYRGIKFL
jgi:hypothetical protein